MAHPIKHFITVIRHRNAVLVNCFKAGIPLQGLVHDLSKYSLTEFLPGAKYCDGTRSPHEYERMKYGYSRAWLHHKGRNRHHFEYWTDYNPIRKRLEPIKMPLKYLVEMFCDRIAASKIYQGEKYTNSSALEYFERGRASRFINEETSDMLEKLLVMLSKDGEEKTFAYVRELVRKKKEY